MAAMTWHSFVSKKVDDTCEKFVFQSVGHVWIAVGCLAL